MKKGAGYDCQYCAGYDGEKKTQRWHRWWTLTLKAGCYEANKTRDGALEILQENKEPLYLLPFIWWEKMVSGEVILN